MVLDDESSIDSSSTLRGSMCVLHHSHPHDGERGSCSHPHDGETGELSDLSCGERDAKDGRSGRGYARSASIGP